MYKCAKIWKSGRGQILSHNTVNSVVLITMPLTVYKKMDKTWPPCYHLMVYAIVLKPKHEHSSELSMTRW